METSIVGHCDECSTSTSGTERSRPQRRLAMHGADRISVGKTMSPPTQVARKRKVVLYNVPEKSEDRRTEDDCEDDNGPYSESTASVAAVPALNPNASSGWVALGEDAALSSQDWYARLRGAVQRTRTTLTLILL
ncbi:hypothetical protein ERJ75_000028000 [Trypanosoma vivax]|nr:hypothetical protein ERJ75_000028000 [Trypanosoma vivax]